MVNDRWRTVEAIKVGLMSQSREMMKEHALFLTDALEAFLDGVPEPDGDADMRAMYTQSPRYLRDVIAPFHMQEDVLRCMAWLAGNVQPHHTVWDVGCSCGFTGLTLARLGRKVAFHDFEGLALQFIRWYAAGENLDNVEVVPYMQRFDTERAAYEFELWLEGNKSRFDGQTTHDAFVAWAKETGCYVGEVAELCQPEHRDWAIALDVIEHTGNHLGFLRWMKELGSTVVFSVPNPPFLPPYMPVVDEWVDTQAIIWTIERRHQLLDTLQDNGRTYLVYR